MTLLKTHSFRIAEHNATLAAFKNNLFRPLQSSLCGYPFTLCVSRKQGSRRVATVLPDVGHLKFAYANHPRYPHKTPRELHKSICQRFAQRLAAKDDAEYMLLDCLRDFRVWANYLDIENLLRLYGTGYKAFMDCNLAVIVFFLAGFSELCFIAGCGARRYLRELQILYDLFTANNPALEHEFTKTPPFQRLQIFRTLGLVDATLVLREQRDPHRVQFPPTSKPNRPPKA